MADARTAALLGQKPNVDLRRVTPKAVSNSLGLLSTAVPSPFGDAVGLLADGIGYAGDPKSLTPGAGLLSLLGLLPMVPHNLAMLAGPMAKTADLTALERAQAMAKVGADDGAIWKETGWWLNAPDGKPRFEMPDGIDQFNKAYPDSGVKFADAGPVGGHYSPSTKTVVSNEGSFAHETQHAVQHQEGVHSASFDGPGATKEQIDAVKLNRADADVLERMEENRRLFGDPSLSDRDWKEIAERRLYLRNMGEAEARAVQSRAGFTEQMRKDIPPWMSYDTPLGLLTK